MRVSLPYGDSSLTFMVHRRPTLHSKIRIHVLPNAQVEVEAPTAAHDQDVFAALLKRARWITERIAEAQAKHTHVTPRTYVSGESHFYLGRRHPLKIAVGSRSVALRQGLLMVTVPSVTTEVVKNALDGWYRERAQDYFTRRLAALCPEVPWLSAAPPIRLRTMRRQWGSCSPSGSINLNPHLIRAPRECVDYVLLHEICHIREHNHSKEFYALLDKVHPGWRPIKARLDGMAELLLAT